MKRCLFTLILVILLAANGVYAQLGGVRDNTSSQWLDDMQVSLVNFYPGGDIYELEGHSALRVRWGGNDFAVSYGTFDFDAPNFVYRYVKGETDYWVSLIPWQPFFDSYESEERRIVEHEIEMTVEQKQRFMDLLNENLQVENRKYRYNYVLDNCATRPIRIVERALGDSIIFAEPSEGSQAEGETFRSIMRRYHANYPWYQFGIDLALGAGIDQPIDTREKTFAPVVLDTQLADAKVGEINFVKSSLVLNDVPVDNAVFAATPWYQTPLTVSCVFLLLTLFICYRDISRRRLTRWFYASVSLLFSLAGMLVWFLVFISEHYATSPNYLMVWLNPFWILFVPMCFVDKLKKIGASLMLIEALATFLLMLLWPLTPQVSNPAFWPLMVASLVFASTYASIVFITNSLPLGIKMSSSKQKSK